MTSQKTLDTLVENVLSDADSEWNQSRGRLGAAALLAAAEQLTHVSAGDLLRPCRTTSVQVL